MISRRGLLGGLSLLPLAGGVTGCAARAAALAQAQANAQAAASGGQSTVASIPVVGPGPRWNGQALSGGAPPVNPTRTTAKPAILWLVPSDQRLVNNITIGVDADAHGGVKQVDFWVEGQVQTVTTPSYFTDTDANGKSRSRYGYWISLDASAFKIISTAGEARIFATAVPNDPTMQSRVIGYDAVSGFDGNYPMRLYPRTAANDFTLTIGSGGTYATLDTAIAAAKTINSGSPAEAPLFRFVSTGFYELNNAASNYGGGKGFATFVANSGVTATLGRSTPFSPTNTASWNWTPGWDGVEFRGSGIVFDQKNWALIAFTSKSAWFNGCKFTNSIGTLFSYYWNGAQHPGFGGTGANYWDDVTTEHVSRQGALGGQRYVQRVASNQYLDDYVSGTHLVVGTYVNSYDISGFIANYQGTPIASLKITGPAGATVSKDATDAVGGHLHLRVNGSDVTSIPLGFYSSDANATLAALAAAINAFGSGWSASVQNGRDAMRPSALTTNFPSGTTFTDVAASGAGASLAAGFDMHVDWWQGYSGSTIRENVILRNNTARGINQTSSVINGDDGSNGAQSWDHILKGNAWLGNSSTGVYLGGPGSGPSSTSHFVFENNTLEPPTIRVEVDGHGNPVTTTDKVYSSVKNCVFGAVFTGQTNNAGWTNDWPWINCCFMYGNGYGNPAINTGANSGNFSYANPGGNQTTNFQALFLNYAAGDVRPVSSGLLLSNLKPKINALANDNTAFAASDVVGALSINSPAPKYPF